VGSNPILRILQFAVNLYILSLLIGESVMEADSVHSKVVEIVAKQLNVRKDMVTPSSTFGSDLGADSLDIAELVMALEDTFEITISDEAMKSVKTVGDVVKEIEKLKA
jgi:acyl carrier protein